MKKLMILVAAATIGLASNAAQIQWGNFFGSYEDIDGNAFAGGTALLYVLTDSSKTISFDSTAGSWNLNGATLIATSAFDAENEGWGAADWVDGGSSVVATGDTMQYFTTIIVDKAAVAGIDGYYGNYTTITAQGSQEVVDPSGPTYGVNVMTFEDITASDWSTAAAVPEPTSGLLLLLGMAGLALRRKKA